MYAVFRTGGKEYRVSPGDVVRVEKVTGEAGAGVEFNHVLAVRKQSLTLGTPLVENARVTGVIVRNARAKKVSILKYKRKKQYRKLTGHRQSFSEVLIKDIVTA
jgi:large subunit ribosomal protein L21